MSLVRKFKDWVKNECKVEYDTLAMDVRGLAEHVEEEIALIEHHYDGIISIMREAHDAKIARLEQTVAKLVESAKPVGYPHPATISENPTPVGPVIAASNPVIATPLTGSNDVSTGA